MQFDSSEPTTLPEGEIFGKSKEFWQNIADEMVLGGVMIVNFLQSHLAENKFCEGPRIATASLFLRDILHNWNE